MNHVRDYGSGGIGSSKAHRVDLSGSTGETAAWTCCPGGPQGPPLSSQKPRAASPEIGRCGRLTSVSAAETPGHIWSCHIPFPSRYRGDPLKRDHPEDHDTVT
ncbi:hypothetical protein NHX12_021951 [Muraenolepis orangiensis]|uniref:Uncharacterized protein n=1 Tax=Muraenolepis orangiensis TaxID=630683 RepID=A0A9Q0ESK7_9TELE|nr:hypothetical protein NHX12_021951 [Muraenolepis orangiensis]